MWRPKPRNPTVTFCSFCGENPAKILHSDGQFCSQWCINYWNMNGRKPCTVCQGCGWRGADVDFVTTCRPGQDTEYVKLCMTCCPMTNFIVSDEEFEAYRLKILEDM